jgi:hypothetical protein
VLLLVAAVVSTFMGTVHPAAGATQSIAFTGEPVTIRACEGSTIPAFAAPSEVIVPTGEIANVRISFVNQSPAAATKVLFTVRSGGQTDSIVDSGIFSKGVTITHDFGPAFGGDGAQCSVDAVTFADGSIWARA